MTQPDGTHGDAEPLSPERWAHVRALVEKALTIPSEARPAFFDASCGDDQALRDRVGRLAAACERAGGSWGFLAHPAGELVAPLLVADGTSIAGVAERSDGLPAAFYAALADRYVVGEEIGRGGMATVYAAEDLRHHRRVAIKVLDPHLGEILGAERFLGEIRVTAGLQHPNLLPLFDSGEAIGLLYYVMPFIEAGTLRKRIHREQQLPVDEAVRIVCAIAAALDYAHRRGVVHRDLKPENILLQDGEPLVADFGISLALTIAVDLRLTATGTSLGTPQYMSPEQAAVDAVVDGRSDIYSLGCVLYELLIGDPPFTGRSAHVVIAKVLGEQPSSVRTARSSVPVHVDVALARALSKLPADRFATAHEFADALIHAPAAVPAAARAISARWRRPALLAIGATATVGLASAAWRTLHPPQATSWYVDGNLIDHTHRSAVTITPDGGALVYTGSAAAGRPIMLRPVGQLAARAIAGTEGGYMPFVAPDGKRLEFVLSDGKFKSVSIDGVAATGAADVWRYGNGAWVNDSVIATESGGPGLVKGVPGQGTFTVLTRSDTAHGEGKHQAPLLLPGARAVVFTVSRLGGGPRLVSGQLAIALRDPRTESFSPHVSLGVAARRAIAFVDPWLLYINERGKAIMAVRLDVEGRRTIGTPISVLDDDAGNLETGSLANNGTLLYVRRPRVNTPVLVDSSGAVRPGLANSDESFMYPRISPDGRRFAVQVTSGNRSNVWLYDIASRTRTQLTTSGIALHATWTPDGRRIVFMAGPFGLMSQPVEGRAAAVKVMGTEGAIAPAVTHDGLSVVFQRRVGGDWRIWSASLSGEGAPHQVMDDHFANYMPAVSPDMHWLAYVSKATGNEEVYARPFAGPGAAMQVSDGGGIEPARAPDGHRIYYQNKSALMAVDVATSATTSALAITSPRQLFKGAFDDHLMPHRNYDPAPNGQGFLTIGPPANPEVVVGLNWLTELRARLVHAR